MPQRIGAIDDHPVILAGLSSTITRHLDAVVDPVVSHVRDFLDRRPDVDVVLLDVELRDGTEAADNVATLLTSGYRVLLFTQDQRLPIIARAFRAGAAGVLSKSEDLAVIAEAIATVSRGEAWLSAEWADALLSDVDLTPHLSPRELETVRLYAAGMSLASIAARLFVTEDTVSTNLSRVRSKYAAAGRPARDRTDIYRRVVADGILPLPES